MTGKIGDLGPISGITPQVQAQKTEKVEAPSVEKASAEQTKKPTRFYENIRTVLDLCGRAMNMNASNIDIIVGTLISPFVTLARSQSKSEKTPAKDQDNPPNDLQGMGRLSALYLGVNVAKTTNPKKLNLEKMQEKNDLEALHKLDTAALTDKQIGQLQRWHLDNLTETQLHSLDLTKVKLIVLDVYLEVGGGVDKITKQQADKILNDSQAATQINGRVVFLHPLANLSGETLMMLQDKK